MKPIKIRMQYFGPYVDETVDFSRFFDKPVFLIAGKTGSGKTTILDAIVYALFGETSGQVREGNQLRANFAGPDERTVVSLVFEHQDTTYTLIRQPKQVLRKKRGTGNKEYGEEVSLTYYVTPQKEVTLKKSGQVRQKILAILGLTAEQFRQVVLLPQEQFNKFLLADSDEKEKTLRTIFRTEAYQQWKEQMVDAAKKMVTTLQKQEAQLAAIKSQVDPQGDLALDSTDHWLNTWNERIADQQADLQKQQARIAEQKRIEKEWQDQLVTYQQINDRLQELRDLQTQLQSLQAELPQRQADKQRVALLEWVQTQVTTLTRRNEAQKQLREGQQHQQEQQARMEKVKLALEKWAHKNHKVSEKEQRAVALNQSQEQLQNQAQMLQQLADLDGQFSELQDRLVTAQRRQTELEDQVVIMNANLQQDLHRQIELSGQKEDLAVKIVAQEQRYFQLKQSAQSIGTQAERLKHLQKEKKNTHKRILQAKQEVQQADRVFAAVNNDWVAKQIAQLAQQLEPGTPCPVCGALDHPRVATTQITSVTEADYEKAQAERERAGNYLHQQEAIYAQLQEQVTNQTADVEKLLNQFTEMLSQDVTVESNADCQAVLMQEQTALTQSKKQVEFLENKLADITQKVTQATAQKQQNETGQATIATQITDWHEQQQIINNKRNELLQQVPAGVHLATIEQQIQANKDFIAQVATARKALDQEKNTLDQNYSTIQGQLQIYQQLIKDNEAVIHKCGQELERAVSEAPVAMTIRQLEEYTVNLAGLPQLRAKVTNWFNDYNNRQQQYAKLQDQTTGQKMHDLSPLKEKLQALRTQQEQSNVIFGRMQRDLTEYEQVYTQVKQLWESFKHNETQQRFIHQLVEAVAGNNRDHHLSLERFVLQHYLEQVLQVANERLPHLLQDRYYFTLSSEESKYRKTTGLQINVFDEFVGTERSVSTLSGGEGFIASLTLALALGEVIQSQHGGPQVEALFIDEGFDSLDIEALNNVLDSIRIIEGQNRLIGMISHVEGMEEEIPNQLQVIQENGRSHIRYMIDGVIQS